MPDLSPLDSLPETDRRLVIAFAGCSLDEKPGSNWVQNVGGLPEYICRIARAVKKSGHSTSQAIAIAVGTAKRWAHGSGKVNASTRAKAAAAVADWERKKAQSHAQTAAKHAGRATVAASGLYGPTYEYLSLCGPDFNVDSVRNAWNAQESARRDAIRQDAVNSGAPGGYDIPYVPYRYIKEMWSSFLIIAEDDTSGNELCQVPYTVEPDGDVDFGDETPVVTMYIPIPIPDDETLESAADDDSAGPDAEDAADAASDTPSPMQQKLALIRSLSQLGT
jgi:hypothetical protein